MDNCNNVLQFSIVFTHHGNSYNNKLQGGANLLALSLKRWKHCNYSQRNQWTTKKQLTTIFSASLSRQKRKPSEWDKQDTVRGPDWKDFPERMELSWSNFSCTERELAKAFTGIVTAFTRSKQYFLFWKNGNNWHNSILFQKFHAAVKATGISHQLKVQPLLQQHITLWPFILKNALGLKLSSSLSHS